MKNYKAKTYKQTDFTLLTTRVKSLESLMSSGKVSAQDCKNIISNLTAVRNSLNSMKPGSKGYKVVGKYTVSEYNKSKTEVNKALTQANTLYKKLTTKPSTTTSNSNTSSNNTTYHPWYKPLKPIDPKILALYDLDPNDVRRTTKGHRVEGYVPNGYDPVIDVYAFRITTNKEFVKVYDETYQRHLYRCRDQKEYDTFTKLIKDTMDEVLRTITDEDVRKMYKEYRIENYTDDDIKITKIGKAFDKISNIINIKQMERARADLKAKGLTEEEFVKSDTEDYRIGDYAFNYVMENIPLSNSPYDLLQGYAWRCTDEAQIVIALADYMGFPTRLVYDVSPHGNHAWAEVYYNNQWIVIDTDFMIMSTTELYKMQSGGLKPSDILYRYSF